MTKFSGRCLCGAVTWRASGPATRNLVCHCADCQRATSSPFTAFLGFVPDTVKWSGDINHFKSSPGSFRGFCPACGSRLYFRSAKWPGEIHIHAATLNAAENYQPSAQVVTRSRMLWLDRLTEIPAHNDFQATPSDGKGGAKREPDGTASGS